MYLIKKEGNWFFSNVKSNNSINYDACLIKDFDLKVGTKVVTNGGGQTVIEHSTLLEGIIGELGINYFYVWHNDARFIGSKGKNNPKFNGYRYSWKIHKKNEKAYISSIGIEIFDVKEGIYCIGCQSRYAKETIVSFNGKNYCESCFDRLYYKCSVCRETKKKERNNYIISRDKKYICINCKEKHYEYCDYCGNIHLKKDTFIFKERRFCPECKKDYITKCKECGEIEITSEMKLSFNGNGYICMSCFNKNYFSCHKCGKTYKKEDIHTFEGRKYCLNCYDEVVSRNLIREYSYSPNFEFKKMNWENTLYLGIELEVQRKTGSNSIISCARKLKDFLFSEKTDNLFYFKKDGSVHDGFEIVSQPMTLQYIHKNIKFNKIFDFMQKNGFQSEESGACGLHIHVSKDFFEDNDIIKMRLFFAKNKEKLYAFSRRKGVGDNYCQFEQSNKEYLKSIINDMSTSGRYWALNTNSSKETIEFRLFRGTLDYMKFISAIQFADAISNFVKVHGLTCFLYGEQKYKNNSWELFIDWAKQQNQYNELVKHLKGEKLCV